jgi:type I restriction enzyme S subunit
MNRQGAVSKAGWSVAQLDDLCEVNIGRTPARDRREFWGPGFPWLSIADMKKGRNIATTKETITELALRECNCRPVSPGTVLLSFKLSIGKVGIARIPLYTNEAIAALPIRDEAKLLPEYLYWALKSTDLTTRLDRAAKGLTLNRAKLLKVEVLLPPIAEQRRLVEVLNRAEALRSKRRTALAQLDALTQAIFLAMFGDPIANPQGLPVRTMIDLVDPERPISYGILMPGPEPPEGVKYVRVVDMKDGGIELTSIRRTTEEISNSFRRSLLRTGDLLMSIRGHVGRVATVPRDLDGANITQDTARLAVIGASPIFIRECLRTKALQQWMAKHTKGVAVRGINLGDVKLMPVIVPPRSSQETLARRIVAVEKVKAAYRASLFELDALFSSLQHRAFRGEL